MSNDDQKNTYTLGIIHPINSIFTNDIRVLYVLHHFYTPLFILK